ncbi:short-chain dehydrogenase/reductase SDR [Corynebacterium maris DSM 45190]|uniref:Short-chain dehydrogenase/reductase SDR n=1 Tax=Corynebacterium maris DSM 45190 TaxID=1224163 RepID=S5SVW0_9CORY|nr:SDR family NAD(P)-dependent oxidoreductase [Corynebacterium maris]AGS35359.1 short-chain dehydrogenase/reductase SDR [Corynebacterium maris DSM 45190]
MTVAPSAITEEQVSEKLINLFDLRGTHALITGGASGIGFHIAQTLGQAGAQVTLLDRNAEQLQSAASSLAETRIDAYAAEVDITDYDAFDTAVAEIAATRPFQVIFANAGISAGPGPVNDTGTITSFDRQRWQDVIDVNLTGAVNSMSVAARYMTPEGRGRIIVTASLAGVRADPLVGYAYAASKTAVIGLVRNAALELAPQGITVNAFAPGLFETNIRKNNPAAQALTSSFAKMSALGRPGDLKELEGLAVYLASPSSSYMTGTVLNIDGGGQHVGPIALGD